MSGAFDYAPFAGWIIRSQGAGGLINFGTDALAYRICADIITVGKPVQFTDIQPELVGYISEDTTYYVNSVTLASGSSFSISATLGGATLIPPDNTTLAYYATILIAGVSHGDTCFKPKLTKDQLSRKFTNLAQQYKKPIPADKLKAGVVFDGVTGTVPMGQEKSLVY